MMLLTYRKQKAGYTEAEREREREREKKKKERERIHYGDKETVTSKWKEKKKDP